MQTWPPPPPLPGVAESRRMLPPSSQRRKVAFHRPPVQRICQAALTLSADGDGTQPSCRTAPSGKGPLVADSVGRRFPPSNRVKSTPCSLHSICYFRSIGSLVCFGGELEEMCNLKLPWFVDLEIGQYPVFSLCLLFLLPAYINHLNI